MASRVSSGSSVVQSYFAGAADDSQVRAAPGTGTATYRGEAIGAVISNNELELVSGRTELNADFGAGTISGSVTNIVDNNNRPTGIQANLVNGTITGVDYEGQVEVVDSAQGQPLIDTTRSTFQGGFYGPQAEETAGTIDIVGRDSGTGDSFEAIATYNGTR